MKRKLFDLKTIFSGEGLRGTLVRDGIGSLLLKAGFIFLSFGITLLLARGLGAEKYGIYSYVYALISLFSIPAQFGLPTLVVRETAQAMARQDYGPVRGVWLWSGRFVLTSTLILVGLAVLAVYFFGSRFSPDYVYTFYWGLALVPLVALGDLRGAALRGLNKVFNGQLPEQLLVPGFTVLLLLGAMFAFQTRELTPSLAMALHVLAAAISFSIGAWLLWRATPSTVRVAAPSFESRRWLSSTLPLAFVGGMQLINTRISLVVLGVFATPADVGIYRVADQMAMLVSVGLQVMGMVTAPQFARLYAVGDKSRLQRLATASARSVLFLTLPVVVFFLLFGRQFLGMVFGNDFIPAYAPLTILAVGQLINAATGTVGILLNMTGFEQDTARVLAFAAAGNVVLNLILVPLLGLNGAAIASAVTLTIWNIMLWLAVRRRLNINSMAFDLIK